jgi:Tfp pilus assembly protein PilF
MRRVLLAAGMAAILAAPVTAYAAGSSTESNVTIGDVKRSVDRGDYRKAISKAKEYLEENSRSADAYNYIGYSYRQMGDNGQARSAYDKALSIDPSHVGAHEYYGELEIKVGNMGAAEAHLAKLTQICGSCEEQKMLAGKIARAKAGG